MTCGTLIGSYRHHKMAPWDLDHDVAVLREDMNRTI